MIISHRHQFIFIKTPKTAGTSIEIALSRYCGPDDVITPILSRGDEALRRQRGYPTSQNYFIPLRHYRPRDWIQLISRRKRAAFRNHIPACLIRKYVPSHIWRTYFKFCFDRELLDKYISWVCYRYPHETPTFQQMLNDGEANILDARVMYTEKSQLIVDQVYPYHQLDEALDSIRQRLGLGPLELPRTKANYRPKGSDPALFLPDQEREKILAHFSEYIEHLGRYMTPISSDG